MPVLTALLRAGVSQSIARAEAPRAEAAMRERGITTQARARDFLAQVLHESGGLNFFEEIASGAAYEGRRDLGNTHPGDGRRFKGRGPIQLTGRSNYRWAGQALHLPLEAQPTLAARHVVGWRIAALYWQSRGLNQLADANQFLTITRRINGGTNGLASRLHYRALLMGADCRPSAPDPLAVLTPTERRWCVEYDRLKRADQNKPRRRQLRVAMASQARTITQRAASEPHGWDKSNRRVRYHELGERSGLVV